MPAGSSSKKSKANHNELGPIFANDLAYRAITAGGTEFPAGSILAREKLAKPSDTKPQLLAVMIKHESGFNPDARDWEFLLIDGSLKKVKLHQKTGACLDCHQSQAVTDYVYPLK